MSSDPSGEGRHSDGELLAIERDRALWAAAALDSLREQLNDAYAAIAEKDAALEKEREVREKLVAALKRMMKYHACGTTCLPCDDEECDANVARAALAASKEIK